ncbi:MAG: hypothetical protein JRN35_07635 [Nitrososphaerota archaeon]|nr:hypothetical protein [Nitrososphaerota archaeon]
MKNGKIYFVPMPTQTAVWFPLKLPEKGGEYALCGTSKRQRFTERAGRGLSMSIPPRRAAVVSAQEVIGLPNDITAIVATSYSNIGAEGLEVIPGKLDPGNNPIAPPILVIVNHSSKRKVIAAGERVASIAFAKLSGPVPPVERDAERDHSETLTGLVSDSVRVIDWVRMMELVLAGLASGVIVLLLSHYFLH